MQPYQNKHNPSPSMYQTPMFLNSKTPKSPKYLLFTYSRPQSRYYLYAWPLRVNSLLQNPIPRIPKEKYFLKFATPKA